MCPMSIVNLHDGMSHSLRDSDEQIRMTRSRRTDYRQCKSVLSGARYLFECGYKLRANPITIATGATIYHLFFRECHENHYDKYLVAATALFIAGKIKNESYQLRDVINVAHQTINRGFVTMDLKEEYWLRRDAIVQCELLMMRALKFQLNLVVTPHKHLLHYLETLRGWLPREDWDTVPICQSAFSFLQDFYHDPAVLNYSPQLIALACISLSLQCYGVDVPFVKDTDHTSWYTYFYKDARKEVVWNIMELLMDIYNKEPNAHD